VVDGRNRKYYAITAAGRDELAAQVRRVEANAAVARRALGLKPA
jgi:DNA-binding PadR family transcriptional regulator